MWRRRWQGRVYRIRFCRRGVPVVPRIDPGCNGGIARSERFHGAKAFGCVAVGHFKMSQHTGCHCLTNLMVPLNHHFKLSQYGQDLGHLVPYD